MIASSVIVMSGVNCHSRDPFYICHKYSCRVVPPNIYSYTLSPLGSHGTSLVALCEYKRSSYQLGMLNISEYPTIQQFLAVQYLNAGGGAIVLS